MTLSNLLLYINNMEEIVKIMSRGLIALPSEIRKKMELKEGDILRVEVREDKVILKKEKRIYDFKGVLSEGKPSSGKSFADVLKEELGRKGGKA